LTITASNGILPDATQDFTLTVTQPVAIGATDQAVFQVGDNGTHTVVTTPGYPTSRSLTLDGTLPRGLSFSDNGDGTGTLSGSPGVGSGGDYPVTISASNGVGTAAIQQLDITVNEQPTITSADTASATIGVTSSFTVTTTPGYPIAYTLSESGALPPGLSLTIVGGSATISGVPTGLPGDFPITLTASNGVAPDTVQTLALTVANAAAVPLPLIPPIGGGGVSGVPANTHPGESFTVTASGFAAGAPITWGIYSSPRTLASTVADGTGTATVPITIPAGFAGLHTIVATGIAPDGSSLVASATTTVTTPSTTLAQLPTTGTSLGTSPDAAVLLLGLGMLFVLVARLRRRRRRA
jgi:Putative Ig domain